MTEEVQPTQPDAPRSDMEAARRSRDQQYRLVVEGMDQGIWVIDAASRTTFVNTRLATMLGYTPEQMIGRTIFDFMDEQERPSAADRVERRRRGIREQHDFRFRHRDGRDVWTHLATGPLTDARGDYEGAIAVVTEITEQRAVDEALRRERERFRSLVQGSNDLILVTTADGTVDYASPAIETILGYRPADIRGRAIEELLVDRSQVDQLRHGVRWTSARPVDPLPNEVELRHRSGERRTCEVVVRDLLDDPNVTGVVLNVRDVSEIRTAERRLRALFEASNDIVTVLQNDGTWYASPAGTRILGHPPGYEPEGGLLSMIHPDDLERCATALAEVQAGRRDPDARVEFRARTATGEYRWLEAGARDLSDDPVVQGIVITARDVTERRVTESALREAEQRFAAAFASSPVGLGIIGLDRHMIDCNTEFCRILGRDRAEILGTDAATFLSPDTRTDTVVAATAHAKDHGPGSIEPIRLRRPDGSEVWVRADAKIVFDDSGNRLYVVVTVTDVTTELEAELAKQRNADWFAALLRNQKDIVTVVGLDGTFHFISPNAEHVLGYCPDELIGTSGIDDIHPDDLERLMSSLAEQLDGHAESRPVEYRQRKADGEWIWLEATASMLDPEFGIEGVVVNARDVSERRRAQAEQRDAEEQFRNAFVDSPVGIGFAALSGRLTWVNRALSRMVGIPEDVLLGTRFQDLSRAEELDAELAETARLLAGEIDSYVSEKRYDHPDGRTVWGLLHVSLVRDAAGAPKQLLGQVEDITDRKQRELQHAHDAEHDALTGLWNRAGIRRLIDDAWRARTPAEPLAMLFGDLDGFKQVNDVHGHDAGDQVLVHVAQRLQATVRGGDQVARWGGDEFVVLCPGVRDAAEAEAIAARLGAAVSAPYAIGAGAVSVGISIGVALDDGHRSSDQVLREADASAYRAKLGGPDPESPRTDDGRGRCAADDRGHSDIHSAAWPSR